MVNTDIQKKTPPKQGFVTTRDTITGRNQATKQKQTEECIDVFHFQHPAKTINLSDTFTLYKPARAIYTRV